MSEKLGTALVVSNEDTGDRVELDPVVEYERLSRVHKKDADNVFWVERAFGKPREKRMAQLAVEAPPAPRGRSRLAFTGIDSGAES